MNRWFIASVLLIVGVAIVAQGTYGASFNFTLTGGYPREDIGLYLRPTAAVNDTIGSVSSIKDDIFIINRASSGLQRTILSIKSGVNLTRYGGNTISIREYTELGHVLPPNIENLEVPAGDVSLDVFVVIDAPTADMDWALLKVQYSFEDFSADIAEESVHLAGYDPDSDEWIRLRDAPSWASSTGVDVDNNYAWANITRFGIFGLMGGGMTADSGRFEVFPKDGFKFDLRRAFLVALFLLVLFAFIKALRRGP